MTAFGGWLLVLGISAMATLLLPILHLLPSDRKDRS